MIGNKPMKYKVFSEHWRLSSVKIMYKANSMVNKCSIPVTKFKKLLLLDAVSHAFYKDV